MNDFFQHKGIRVSIKILLVLVNTLACFVVGGMMLPIVLIVIGIMEDLGLANLMYFFEFGIVSILIGAIWSSRNLFKSQQLITKHYLIFISVLFGLGIIYNICYFMFMDAFSKAL